MEPEEFTESSTIGSNQTNTSENQNKAAAAQKKQQLKLKPNLRLRYKDDNGEWINARIISRGGKVGGKHEGWFNIETESGIKRAVDFSNIKDICDDDDTIPQTVLIASDPEILEAKLKELESWKIQEVYSEVKNIGQDYMSLRWVVTPKVVEGRPSVKARLVARGFEEIQNFRTDSPTCSREGLRIALTVISSEKWKLNSLDVKTAFLQGEEINRDICVEPPAEANTTKLWKLRKTVYGLADASRNWYLKLRKELINLGAKAVDLDQGMFIWLDDSGQLIGLMACFVDDVLWAGNEDFTEIIEQLKKVFQFGNEQSDTFKYIGIELQRNDNGNITLRQDDYIEKLDVIYLNKERNNCDQQEPVTDDERSRIRKTLGQLNWLAGMTRPEISFTVSDISSRIRDATISDIKRINKIVKFLKSHRSYIQIPVLDLNSLSIKVFADASFNNLHNGQSQGGHIIVCADSIGNCSLISWNSNRVRRVVRSTLAAETLSFTDGADSAIYFSKLIQEFTFNIPPIICYTDSRSLFESAGSYKPVNDRRLRVEINAIREMLLKNEITIKWIDGKQQISDVLTKKGASPFLLMDVIQSGKYSC